MSKNIKLVSLIFIIFLMNITGFSQNLLLDELIQAGELNLFPSINNRNEYYYLPDNIVISRKANGDPEFSFIKYVTDNLEFDATQASAESDGGGFFHTVVEFQVSPETINESQSILRRTKSSAIIKGPVIYDQGTVKIVSAVEDESGNFIQQVVGTGNAPILEGQKASISFRLTKEGATLLEETFKQGNSLIALGFEMQLSGYRSPKQVIIEANFDNIYQHENIQAAAVTPVFASEINLTFDELRNSGAINVTQIGADEKMESAMETAYNKLTSLIFEQNKSQAPTPPDPNKKSMLDRMTDMLNNARKEVRESNSRIDRQFFASQEEYDKYQKLDEDAKKNLQTWRKEIGLSANESENNSNILDEKQELPSIAIGASYMLKRERRSGSYRLNLNKYTVDTKLFPMSQNLYPNDCSSCYQTVDLEDEVYNNRIISAQLDGLNTSSFDKYINFVTITLNKKHGNGETTQREIKIDRGKFNADANNFVMDYGWKNDVDRLAWLHYDYKVVWSFFGGQIVEEDWKSTTNSIISLSPPYRLKKVEVDVDPTFIEENKVRGADLRFYYLLENKEYLIEKSLNFNRDGGTSTDIELILPQTSSQYDYEITYYIRGGDNKSIGRNETSAGSIYLETF